MGNLSLSNLEAKIKKFPYNENIKRLALSIENLLLKIYENESINSLIWRYKKC